MTRAEAEHIMDEIASMHLRIWPSTESVDGTTENVQVTVRVTVQDRRKPNHILTFATLESWHMAVIRGAIPGASLELGLGLTLPVMPLPAAANSEGETPAESTTTAPTEAVPA